MNEDNKIVLIPLSNSQKDESNPTGLCIWCKESKKKNIAHIISRKLTKEDIKINKLKKSVCSSCNTYFGNEIEDWFFKYSPIGYWKEQLIGDKIFRNFQFVPNFVFLDFFQKWVVVNHSDKDDLFPTQLMLKNDGTFTLFRRELEGRTNFQFIYEDFKNLINVGDYTVYKTNLFEKDFHPRLFKHNGKCILLIKDEIEHENYKIYLRQLKPGDAVEELIVTNAIGKIAKMQVHFRWSVKKYMRFCAKIAFEFLSVLKGADYVLADEFDSLRTIIKTIGKDDDIRVKYEDGKGYMVNRLAFAGWIGMTDDLSSDIGFSIPVLFIKDDNKFTTSVVFYKYDDYLCAIVKMFDIDPCAIILAKTKSPLGGIYAVAHNFNENTIRFLEGTNSLDDSKDFIIMRHNADFFDHIN